MYEIVVAVEDEEIQKKYGVLQKQQLLKLLLNLNL